MIFAILKSLVGIAAAALLGFGMFLTYQAYMGVNLFQ